MKKKVLLRAPLLTNSGYGVHSRQLFEWLLEKDVELDVECLKWGNTPWILREEKDNDIVNQIMSRSVALRPPYDATFQLQLPDEWNPELGKFNVGISAFVETDKCNPAWVEMCNKMDKVVVPSTFTKNVVRRSGMLKNTVEVIPEWFNENIHEENITNLECVDSDYNYLIVGQLTALDPDLDRKNIVNSIRWLSEEFKDCEDV